MSGDANKHKTVTATYKFDDALGLIHETIGCADVMRKPELSYKLSDSAQKSSAIGLESEEDWAGLCEEVVARQRKKKITISVEIIVHDNVCSELISCEILLTCYSLVHALPTRACEGWKRWEATCGRREVKDEEEAHADGPHQENSSLLKPTENLLKLLISVDFSRIFSVAIYLFKKWIYLYHTGPLLKSH